MTKESDDFEKQITRIHKLLDGANSQVTWDDKIPDPDNPSQPRQIDFTIRNPNSFIIGECRFRKSPEDVKWIEELIGRKLSFKADGVIAVSSSGFTKGAIKKAKAYGIVLRNFFEITEKELESWGKRTRVNVIFAKLTDLTFSFSLIEENRGPFTIRDEKGREVPLLGFLQKIVHQVDDLEPKNETKKFRFECEPDKDLFICGEKLGHLTVTGIMEKYSEDLELLAVMCYAESKKLNGVEEAAFVQKLHLAQSEIIGFEDNVSFLLDCSEMSVPRNTLFYGMGTSFDREVNMESLTILGIEKAFSSTVDIKYDVRFKQKS